MYNLYGSVYTSAYTSQQKDSLLIVCALCGRHMTSEQRLEKAFSPALQKVWWEHLRHGSCNAFGNVVVLFALASQLFLLLWRELLLLILFDKVTSSQLS